MLIFKFQDKLMGMQELVLLEKRRLGKDFYIFLSFILVTPYFLIGSDIIEGYFINKEAHDGLEFCKSFGYFLIEFKDHIKLEQLVRVGDLFFD